MIDGFITERFIYKDQLAPIAKVDADGNVLEEYIYGKGINSPDYIRKDGVNYRVIKDHLGSIRMIVNTSTGEVVKTLRYSEFGEITEEAGTFDTIFGFAGGIRDTDTGLIHFGARWYDPEVGRWISKEPLGFEGSMNFYSYCDGDPVNKIDPSGLAWEIIKNPDWSEAQNSEFENMVNTAITRLRIYSPTAAMILDTLEYDTKFKIRITHPLTDFQDGTKRGNRHSSNEYNGFNSTVYYDPSFDDICSITPEWEINQPDEIGLIHEMIHALHNRGGVFKTKEDYFGMVNLGEEYYTVGLGIYANEPFTENQVRKEYMKYYPFMSERRRYGCK